MATIGSLISMGGSDLRSWLTGSRLIEGSDLRSRLTGSRLVEGSDLRSRSAADGCLTGVEW